MKRRVQLSRATSADMASAQRYYERQEAGLGQEFRRTLNRELQTLAEGAGVHRVVHGLHRKVCRRFPFVIFYQVERNRPHSRRPGQPTRAGNAPPPVARILAPFR